MLGHELGRVLQVGVHQHDRRRRRRGRGRRVIAAGGPKLRESCDELDARGRAAWASARSRAVRVAAAVVDEPRLAPPRRGASIAARSRGEEEGQHLPPRRGPARRSRPAARGARRHRRSPPASPPRSRCSRPGGGRGAAAAGGRRPAAAGENHHPIRARVLVEDALPVAVGVGVHAVDEVVLREEQPASSARTRGGRTRAKCRRKTRRHARSRAGARRRVRTAVAIRR